MGRGDIADCFVQWRSSLGLWPVQRAFWKFGLGNGWFYFSGRPGALFDRVAAGLVPSVPFGGTIRLQHHHPENLVARSLERFAARNRPGLSAAGAGAQACRMDRTALVV